MNMMFRSLGPPVELNEPNVCSTEVGLTSMNTLRILNTIKPVTRAFTTMDAVKPVIVSMFPQRVNEILSSPAATIIPPCAASQVARDDKLKIGLSNEDRFDWPRYVIAKKDGMIMTQIFLPHTIQQR